MPQVPKNLYVKMKSDLLSSTFIKFVLVGIVSATWSILSRFLFQTYFSYVISVFLATLIGMIVNFSLNRIFVFKENNEKIEYQFAKFFLVSLVSLVLVPVSAVILLNWYAILKISYINYPTAELLSHFGGMIINAVYGFFMAKYYIFKKIAP